MKIFKQLLLSILMISFTACSSDDDSSGTPEGPAAMAKVKEFKRITTQTDLVLNGIENILTFEYNANGKVSKLVEKTIHENPIDNGEIRYTIQYNNDETVQSVTVEDIDFGETDVVNFNYTSGRLSSLTASGETISITYNSATGTYSCVPDPESPDFVVSVSFNSENDVVGVTGILGTYEVSTNANNGVFAGTPINQELKVYLMMVSDPIGNFGFFQTKEITEIHASGESIFGPIDPTTINIGDVERNADGLIQAYSYSDDPRFEITYMD